MQLCLSVTMLRPSQKGIKVIYKEGIFEKKRKQVAF